MVGDGASSAAFGWGVYLSVSIVFSYSEDRRDVRSVDLRLLWRNAGMDGRSSGVFPYDALAASYSLCPGAICVDGKE